MDPRVVDLPAVMTAAIRRTVPMSEIRPFFDTVFPELASALAWQGGRARRSAVRAVPR